MVSPEALWAEFAAATGVEATYEAFGFGSDDNPGLRDELARQVLQGRKRATAGHYGEYEATDEKIPEVGGFSVVVDSTGQGVAVIRTVSVELARFGDVDESFARDEGEGDGTVAWWREAHRRYFTEAGLAIDDDTVLVLERFEKVWPR